MVVKVHCGTILGDAFQHCGKFVPQNSPTMHFHHHLDLVSAQPQSGEYSMDFNFSMKTSVKYFCPPYFT